MQYNQPSFPMPNMFHMNHLLPTGNLGEHALPRQNLVGEGNVTPVVGLDGNIQFFFTPVTQYNVNPYFSNCLPIQAPNTWFVRNICNPVRPSAFVQQFQNPFEWGTPWRPEGNVPFFGNSFKFHNDSWTSTTDLHYFCPALRANRKVAAAIQAQYITPTQDQNIGTSRQNFCRCGLQRESAMSVDCAAETKHRCKHTECFSQATLCPRDTVETQMRPTYEGNQNAYCDNWFENVVKENCKNTIMSSSESSVCSQYGRCMPS